MVREAFKGFGRQDEKREEGGGVELPNLIPYPSISLFRNPALQPRGSSHCQ